MIYLIEYIRALMYTEIDFNLLRFNEMNETSRIFKR